MITIRKGSERGHANHGWLDSYFTFSFADYHDSRHVQFRSLRVINEDTIQGGGGFPTHPHRDMEIVTYVMQGALRHQDSMGNASAIEAGEVQRMSAGTGVRHSEFNNSPADPVHLFQIWILPERDGLPPGYEQRRFSDEEKRGRLRLIASPDGRDGSVTIHQDAAIHATLLAAGQKVEHTLAAGRHAWLQVARGEVELNGCTLQAGDGAAASEERALRITAARESEALLFDLN